MHATKTPTKVSTDICELGWKKIEHVDNFNFQNSKKKYTALKLFDFRELFMIEFFWSGAKF